MARSKSKSRERKSPPALELSARAAFSWGLCFFLLLAWIFVLGIFVGRGFVPDGVKSTSALKAQIAKLQQKPGNGKSQQPVVGPEEPFEDPKLAFYEDLSTKKEAVARRSLAERNGKQAENSNRMQERKAKKPAVEKEPPPSEGKFTIQVASLGVQDKAKALVGKLSAKGLEAYYYQARIRGKPYYRVNCGRFRTAEEAKRFARKILKSEGINGFVLRIGK